MTPSFPTLLATRNQYLSMKEFPSLNIYFIDSKKSDNALSQDLPQVFFSLAIAENMGLSAIVGNDAWLIGTTLVSTPIFFIIEFANSNHEHSPLLLAW